jgi:hypothetical protein
VVAHHLVDLSSLVVDSLVFRKFHLHFSELHQGFMVLMQTPMHQALMEGGGQERLIALLSQRI